MYNTARRMRQLRTLPSMEWYTSSGADHSRSSTSVENETSSVLGVWGRGVDGVIIRLVSVVADGSDRNQALTR